MSSKNNVDLSKLTAEQLLKFIQSRNLTDELVKETKTVKKSAKVISTKHQDDKPLRVLPTNPKQPHKKTVPAFAEGPKPVPFKDVIAQIEGKKSRSKKTPKHEPEPEPFIPAKKLNIANLQNLFKDPQDKVIENRKPYYKEKQSIKLKNQGEKYFKRYNSVRYSYTPNHQLDALTAPETISKTIMKAYNNIKAESTNRYPQGFVIFAHPSFTVTTTSEHNVKRIAKKQKETVKSYISFNITDPTLSTLEKQLHHSILGKFHEGKSTNTSPVIFDSVRFLVTPLQKKGGCDPRGKNYETIKYKNRTVTLFSPKSSNNNCLFMAFAYCLGISGTKLNFPKIRKELDIPDGKINYDQIDKIAEYFYDSPLLNEDFKRDILDSRNTKDKPKIPFILLNQKQDIIKAHNIPLAEVHIILVNDHYYVVKTQEKKRCLECNKTLNLENDTHKCSNKKISYHHIQHKKQIDCVCMAPCEDKKIIDKDNIIFFDLETFQDTVTHVPYACGYCIGEQEVFIDYGENCMNNLIDLLLSTEDKTLVSFNGSGFDHYFLVSALNERNFDIKNMINCDGNLLSFTFGKNIKVFDLYKFINSSLDSACDAFNIKNAKMSYDILKIQSWEDTLSYRSEVEEYLKYDVLSLRELFFTFNQSVYDYDHVNVTSFCTLGDMAYKLWQSTLTDLVEIPDLEKYEFIRKGLYGARTYPQQRNYESQYHQQVQDGEMSYEELKKTGDYVHNVDVTSLYPASMRGYDFCDVKYPTGFSRWSDNPKEEYDNGKLGYYEITFKCPDIRIPVLPRKKNNDLGLEWSVSDGKGIYSSVDIENAITSGYEVTFINTCLVWDKSGDIFGKYIDRYYKLKQDAEKEGNKVRRSIAKLMLNVLYGKTMQRANFEKTIIVNSYQHLLDNLVENDITQIHYLKNDKLLITFTAKDKNDRITKPAQLGGFILSYSRRIMLDYMKVIDPSLKSMIFTYTDTDSLHLMAKDAQKLIDKGYIVSKKDAKLGYLCNDLDDDGIITKEINLAPKCYYNEYITNDNKYHDLGDSSYKCKGIPKKALTPELFTEFDNCKEEDETNVIKFNGLKRKHKTLTMADKDNGVDHFSIVNVTQTRTFMKSDWEGMNFCDNQWYPNRSHSDDDDEYIL